LSAGEVGAYCVCPEAWRLRSLEKVETLKSEAVEQGHALHQEWASRYEESLFLSRRARVVVALVILAGILYALI